MVFTILIVGYEHPLCIPLSSYIYKNKIFRERLRRICHLTNNDLTI